MVLQAIHVTVRGVCACVCVCVCACVFDVCRNAWLVLQPVHVRAWGPYGLEVGGPLLRLEKGILMGK